MNKKIFFCLLSILFSIIFIELIFQTIPFIYKQIPTSKDKVYIYVIGESTAYGHPYQGKVNFSKIVAETLNWKIDNKKIEIINLAIPGSKPLYQYRKYFLYRYTHPFKKGIVFMYMLGSNGNNFSTDYLNTNYKKYNKVINNSIIFSYIHPYFINMFNFEYYYNAIIKLIHKFGDEAYIATVVGNYSGAMPNNVDSLIENINLRENLNSTDNLILINNYDYALEKANGLLKIYENNSQILYRIGKIYEKQNKIKEANNIYKEMIGDNDIRPTIKENETIRTLTKKYKFNLVDTEKETDNRNEIIGYNYFIDLVHPTIDFNIFIAKQFINELGLNHLIDYNEYNLKEKILSDFSYKDWFIAYRDSLGEIIFYSYIKKINDIYNKEIISKYISNLYELHNKIQDNNNIEFEKREIIIHICEILFEYIQGNKEKTIKLINDYNLKDIILQREKKGEERMQCWWYMKHWLIDFVFENKI